MGDRDHYCPACSGYSWAFSPLMLAPKPKIREGWHITKAQGGYVVEYEQRSLLDDRAVQTITVVLTSFAALCEWLRENAVWPGEEDKEARDD